MSTIWLVVISAVVPFGTLIYVLLTVPRMQAKLDEMRRDSGEVRATYVLPDQTICWFSSCIILGWGLSLWMAPGTLATFPAFHVLAERAPQPAWAAVMASIGLVRIFALVANGRLRQGSPMIRVATSFLGALVWSQFVSSLADYSIVMGKVSPAVTTYGVLFLADVYSCGKSMRDWVVSR